MRTIVEGDVVMVCWSDATFDVKGVVKHVPQDTGDLWYIEENEGAVHAVNPMSSVFVQIVKEKP